MPENPAPGDTVGILLAAGGGRRFGRPKALVRLDGRTLVERAAGVLLDAGCDPVLAVLGADADQAAKSVPEGARVVLAPHWRRGVSASLRAGLEAARAPTPRPQAAVIHLVDLPDVGPDAIRRVLALRSPRALARATYGGVPGHPVLLGRDHWDDVLAALAGDRGAGPFLRRHPGTRGVECADLATGTDTDTPDALRAMGRVT